jgi:SAM-dependent methyltransferase
MHTRMTNSTYDDIDWNDVWMARQRRSSAAGRGGGCPAAWQEKRAAQKYWENNQWTAQAQGRIAELQEWCGPAARLLDVGAGPGTLAVPLAPQVGWITAVEPAFGMAEVLRDNIAERGIANIDIVQKTWDEVDPRADLQPPYDLTVASYSMGMVDLRESVRKMLAVTTGAVILYWHIGNQPWDVEAGVLWPLLHGKEHYPIPKSDILLQVLCQMGIYPHVAVQRTPRVYTFASFEAMLDDYAGRYDVTTEEQRLRLAGYLSGRFALDDGQHVIRAQHNGMKIWWRVQDAPGLA